MNMTEITGFGSNRLNKFVGIIIIIFYKFG